MSQNVSVLPIRPGDSDGASVLFSPGGIDSIAIIAASSKADLSFIMALQTVRFILVMLIGPPISRYAARHLPDAKTDTARKAAL